MLVVDDLDVESSEKNMSCISSGFSRNITKLKKTRKVSNIWESP
jgi:hypothetical protein